MNRHHTESAHGAALEDPNGNRLLSALTDADRPRWRDQLECVDLRRGQVLYEPGQPMFHAYFPTRAVVSLLSTLASGMSAAFATVGHEGMVGVPLLLGVGSTTSVGTVLIAGPALRLRAQAVQEEIRRSDAVRSLLLRYVQALVTQVAQTAVCIRHHTIAQQVCGFLLRRLDPLRDNDIAVTHELIAGLLGVRRESVTSAAGPLQEAGLIECTRGHIAVRDRAGLAQRACECHAIDQQEYERLLPEARRPGPAGRGPLMYQA